MSNRYKGGVISATPPTLVAGAGASGTWTLEQQMQANAAGLWPVNGPFYIEDVFSTYLYTGNGNTAPETQTITNGIDLSGKGGLVWIKNRSVATNNVLFDTARGATKVLVSNATSAESTDASTLTSFNNNGFSVYYGQGVNGQNNGLASWTFRKQPKFFDVVTYTGTGSNLTVNHNLGSAPGCIIIKDTSNAYNWTVYHRSLATGEYLVLNSTGAKVSTGGDNVIWNVTSTSFNVASYYGLSYSGDGYVAYLFAHDAGGFGLTGTDNVISCGSYTGSSNTPQQITLGYEPQWVLLKKSSTTDSWRVFDNMRGMALSTGGNAILEPNTSSAESASSNWILPNATGFVAGSSATDSATYIYIAIRRGPMKVPTDPTKVFAPVQYTSATTPPTVTTGFPVDMIIDTIKGPANENRQITDRLRGSSINFYNLLYTNATNAESSSTFTNAGYDLASNTSTRDGFFGTVYGAGYNCITWNFRRAPSFFDEVCYTGTDSNLTLNHNLGVVPELLIVKARGPTAVGWFVYSAGTTTPNNFYLQLQSTNAQANAGTQVWDNTSTTFLVHSGLGLSYSAYTYVAYLFATCAGVSKVGSYTGTGGTQTIACGFTAGARFVLIKRTDSTGDWWVWDTSRGMVSGTDPRLALNIQTGESTGNWVYTTTGGFQIVTTDASVNASGGTYIFLAIA